MVVDFFNKCKVEVILGQAYDPARHEYDYVIQCPGYTFSTDFLKNDPNFKSCVS